MYYPYFRGKQFELLCIKENAQSLFSDGRVVPIIEPVKRNLAPLKRALAAINGVNGARCILIVNPAVGELKSAQGASEIEDVLASTDFISSSIVPAFIVSSEVSIESIEYFLDTFHQKQYPTVALINLGYPRAGCLAELIRGREHIHIFDHEKCQQRYRAKFKGISQETVILRDGFTKRQTNQEYANVPDEFFSDSSITYDLEFKGFGDYLNIGKDFSESGGPAYSIAIHLTWPNEGDENAIYISHYVSVSNPKFAGNVAGKFHEALSRLMESPEEKKKFLRTEGFRELEEIFERKDFRGLGYLKKLTMLHHIETVKSSMK